LGSNLIGAEVGVNKGEHALQIINFIGGKLYLIDMWEDYVEQHFTNDKPVLSKMNSTEDFVKLRLEGKNIETIKEDSTKAASRFPDGFFDYVYIDASHTYEKAKADLLAWKPKVKKGGVLCGHDYTTERDGVKRAVDEIFPNVICKETEVRYPDWYIRL